MTKPPSKTTELETVLAYHEQTKHRFDGYAKGPDTIDWEAQPNPFRHYQDAPRRDLPLIDNDKGPAFSTIATGQSVPTEPWNEQTLSQLLQYALGLSAWKQYGPSRWSLRCNPSSGNLHPTECYPILLGIRGYEDGLYHYLPEKHQLELRCRYTTSPQLDTPTLMLGLSSLQWREAWKYGERAYRYCQLDIGHAVAALNYSAATLGYRITPLLDVGSEEMAAILGINRRDEFYEDERESGDLLLALHPSGEPAQSLIDDIHQATDTAEWQGRANRVDHRHHYDWPLIEAISKATNRPSAPPEKIALESWPSAVPAATHPLTEQSALRLFQQRRSAQAFDPSGDMNKDDFFRLIDRLLPRSDLHPWSSQAWPTQIHPLLFVHSVEGLASGLYMLVRESSKVDVLKEQLRSDLVWQRVDNAPKHLPLYHLVSANARGAAAKLSCQQAIAGDSVFALAMLAEYEAVISEAPWRYNELLWEAGMLGHTLYLEAEAIGYRGTGIGCFFDDGVIDMLGIKGISLQPFYHFTVGVPLEDLRLVTLPPYSRENL